MRLLVEDFFDPLWGTFLGKMNLWDLFFVEIVEAFLLLFFWMIFLLSFDRSCPGPFSRQKCMAKCACNYILYLEKS